MRCKDSPERFSEGAKGRKTITSLCGCAAYKTQWWQRWRGIANGSGLAQCLLTTREDLGTTNRGEVTPGAVNQLPGAVETMDPGGESTTATFLHQNHSQRHWKCWASHPQVNVASLCTRWSPSRKWMTGPKLRRTTVWEVPTSRWHIYTQETRHQRLRERQSRGGGKIEAEGQNVFCESVPPVYDRETVPMK